jgi:hypothetical protein
MAARRLFFLIIMGPNEAKARRLAQHGGPPGWLEEIDLAGCDFVRDGSWMVHAACPDGPHHLARSFWG